ncbi:MAG: type II toxin-antitoxin system RelE/ParE family toxin [Terriglobales bacterium]
MMRTLVVRGEVAHELNEVYRWYEQRREGLGSAFLDGAEHTLHAIQARPQSFPVVAGEVRRAILHRFPYAIFYRFDENRILVLAVFHGSRKPFA